MQKILVTDTLFVNAQNEQQLQEAGFAVERLPLVAATQQQLSEALQDKVGYILGGTEQVTAPVIASTTTLRAIVHCGSAYKTFIPAWREALAKGIAIATVPDGHTQAVAEWAHAAALAMNRGFLGGQINPGATLPGLESQTIGIIGLGRIARRIATMVQANRPRAILYHSARRHKAEETTLGLTFATFDDVVRNADVLFLCVSGDVGPDFFNSRHINAMKNGALLISFMVPGVINENALFKALQAGKIRAISDYPMEPRFNALDPHVWFSNTISQAFNTSAGLTETSNAAVASLISLLTHGHDRHMVPKQAIKLS